ncbi:MFS transporter [Arthrobacter sp. NyZ413]|uniref:MFS transporter n=1 Tax=Arthrobacter sp. NyZ413 TaxID=3144669 RepID=UPI003BF8A337
MSDQTTEATLATRAEADTPLEPTVAGKTRMGRLLTGVLPATVGMYALYQGIQQVLIPLQVQEIDPKQKVANLAIITAISAVTSLIALPIGGAVSDRTRGRFGRRSPWLLASGITSAILVVIMGLMNFLWPLAIVYAAVWFAANFYQGVWAAILPDRVPIARRGLASSVIGMGTPLGILLGVNYVAQVSREVAYISLGAFLVAATMFLVFFAPEGPYTEPRPVKEKHSVIRRVGEFFSGFSHVNFRYAFASRFLLYLAYFVINGYLLYTLQDRVGVQNVPGQSAAVGIGILVTINTLAWIGSAALSGWLADVFKRRKMFVGIAAVGMGLASLIPVFFPTWTAMVVFAFFVGFFKGSYLAVDFALMSLVLPNRDSEGRDMGLLSVATGAPQLISGAIAGLLITFAGGYVSLFIFGTVVAFLAGLAVIPIRNIR